MLKSLPIILIAANLLIASSGQAMPFKEIFCCCCGGASEVPNSYVMDGHPVSTGNPQNPNATQSTGSGETTAMFNQWNQLAVQAQPVTRQNANIFPVGSMHPYSNLGADKISSVPENEHTNDEPDFKPEPENQND